jgi:hypothetical protein
MGSQRVTEDKVLVSAKQNVLAEEKLDQKTRRKRLNGSVSMALDKGLNLSPHLTAKHWAVPQRHSTVTPQ